MPKTIYLAVTAIFLLSISTQVGAIQTDEQVAARHPSERGPVVVRPQDRLSAFPRTNGIVTLEALERYIANITDSPLESVQRFWGEVERVAMTVEVARPKSLLPGQVGTTSCEDDIEDAFPGINSCVTSKTIAGEAVRMYLEAKYLLRQARARAGAGDRHLDRLENEPARLGWNFPQPSPDLERMIEHARQRHARALDVSNKMELKVKALRSLLLEYNWATEEYEPFHERYLEFNLTPGLDFE